MKIQTDAFCVPEGKAVDLRKCPTLTKQEYGSKRQYRKLLEHHVEKLSALQQLLYASGHNAVLLIFQGMDASGKDGVIRHVMSGVNPQGCDIVSFKQPSAAESAHDFLWRTTLELPERGRIGIFNRSYYEEVLITRVHPKLLRAQSVDPVPIDSSKFWQARYRSIRGLEEHLHNNSTRVVKFFLHLSKEEQRKRLLARIDEPEKNWKFSRNDVKERRFWNEYMRAYQECLSATSSKHAPWYIVPADDKVNARLIVSQVVIETLQRLDMSYPSLSPARRRELKAVGRGLAK
jgi:PPK2 family polyphosphate:nucleotide phosphotransferase